MLSIEMKYLVKKGVKDSNWIISFIENKLEGNTTGITSFKCTDKMVLAIAKTARYLDVHRDRFNIMSDLFYKDDNYFLHVNTTTRKATVINLAGYQKNQFNYFKEYYLERFSEKNISIEKTKLIKKIALTSAYIISFDIAEFVTFTSEQHKKIMQTKTNSKIELMNKVKQIKHDLCRELERLEDIEDTIKNELA